jgi:hypothetical protein
MADLFSVTAPLLIRLPTGDMHVMAERFPHPRGLVYFDLFWHLANPHLGVHMVEGIIKGDGPWKIGDAVVRVLGCHGTDGALARRFNEWQIYLAENADAQGRASAAGDTTPWMEEVGQRREQLPRMSGAADTYPERAEIEAIARRHGALIPL